jgi:hypothetical protein
MRQPPRGAPVMPCLGSRRVHHHPAQCRSGTNLGHESLTLTFGNYGKVASHDQASGCFPHAPWQVPRKGLRCVRGSQPAKCAGGVIQFSSPFRTGGLTLKVCGSLVVVRHSDGAVWARHRHRAYRVENWQGVARALPPRRA